MATRDVNHATSALACAALVALAVLPACRNTNKAGQSSLTSAEHPLPTATVHAEADGGSMNMRKVASFTGMSAPSCVVYDPSGDRYLVSNVVGRLADHDGKAFIGVVPAAGGTMSRWIESGRNGVKLDSPFGIAVSADQLYVADIDRVRVFERSSGAPRGEIVVPGAKYLAGIAVAPDGRVLVADAGVTFGSDGDVKDTSDGAIWAVRAVGEPPTRLATKDPLGGPAALVARADGTLLVATLGDGKVYALDRDGKKRDARTAPRGKLVGLDTIGEKTYVASWGAAAVYRQIEDGPFAVQLADLPGPSGIVIDPQRKLLLVPLLRADRVDAYAIE